jgi:LPXTG-site transpeptidase (sortase) family protein
MWHVHPNTRTQPRACAAAPAMHVFPRYSTLVFKEALTVIGLVLLFVLLVLILALAAPHSARGHSVLSGHRDTHVRFLQDLAPGTRLRIQKTDGRWRTYRVGSSAVIDAGEARLALDTGRPVVTLVTCYPFDAITPGGPLRYLVVAEAEVRRGPPRPRRPVIPAATHHL